MKNILSIALCFVALLACQDIQSQKEVTQMTKSGYKCSIRKDQPGTTAQPGQYALVHAVMCHNDSVISDTRVNPGRPTVVKIEEDEAKRRGGSGPVQDLLLLLSVGDSARLYYPLDSFPIKPERLKGFQEVTYDITVVDIFETQEKLDAYMDAEREKLNAPKREAKMREKEVADLMTSFYESYKQGKKTEAWQTTESGLKYIILEKSGTGITAKKGETVRAHYYGVFADDGKQFDNSFSRGQPIEFAVGEGVVIKGWDEAFLFLEKNDKAVLLIPTDLAWGAQGFGDVIPPNKAVMFYVEFVGTGNED